MIRDNALYAVEPGTGTVRWPLVRQGPLRDVRWPPRTASASPTARATTCASSPATAPATTCSPGRSERRRQPGGPAATCSPTTRVTAPSRSPTWTAARRHPFPSPDRSARCSTARQQNATCRHRHGAARPRSGDGRASAAAGGGTGGDRDQPGRCRRGGRGAAGRRGATGGHRRLRGTHGDHRARRHHGGVVTRRPHPAGARRRRRSLAPGGCRHRRRPHARPHRRAARSRWARERPLPGIAGWCC